MLNHMDYKNMTAVCVLAMRGVKLALWARSGLVCGLKLATILELNVPFVDMGMCFRF